ncbi:gluconate 2-dehydrogenase subunit 3 family protein [Halopiger goleimassiliensis]|uniref:gluconate 2-dehydrogenase subunit 3 family protein n=1 Tax=Halopiger goleimassiliensis TaxID=1293048 RepID=UPI000677B023|nr:gluconate 2-dehydrogenase subunit 3 family protein [Halopiger goleimassiliensis]
MELTRRDAVAALAALGAGGAAVTALHRSRTGGSSASREHTIETMLAAAEVVYPSELEGVEEFVETFLEGRLDAAGHAAGLEATIADLDDEAEGWQGVPFADLSVDDRDLLLRTLGVASVPERPDGTTPERIRYYVVNELLLGLYVSPTGGELAGIENPQGHAGGLETYQRGPES